MEMQVQHLQFQHFPQMGEAVEAEAVLLSNLIEDNKALLAQLQAEFFYQKNFYLQDLQG